jgi:transposase
MGTSGSGTIEAVSTHKALPAAKRQHRSVEFKLQVVEESLAPGASVARVARAHGVNANQVFTWRRLYRHGRLGNGNKCAMPGLLAVRVTESAMTRRASETDRTTSGTIQIELPKGRVRLSGSVDPETLRVVLEALGG